MDATGWFIGLSYLLRLVNYVTASDFKLWVNIFVPSRFLEGAGSAAAATSIMAILMQIFPGRESSITAWTEMSLGFGYMLGTH